jgi:hypothetical protein
MVCITLLLRSSLHLLHLPLHLFPILLDKGQVHEVLQCLAVMERFEDEELPLILRTTFLTEELTVQNFVWYSFFISLHVSSSVGSDKLILELPKG